MSIRRFVTLPIININSTIEDISFNIDSIEKIAKDPEYPEERCLIYLKYNHKELQPDFINVNIPQRKTESLLNGKF